MPVSDLCRKLGIAEHTYHRRKRGNSPAPGDAANGASVLVQTIARIDRGGLELDIPGI